MISIDYTLIIQMVNFLLIMFVLNIVLYRPIRSILKERRAKFAGLESDIGRLTVQADEQVNLINERLVEARRDGYQKKDEIKGLGLTEEKSILAAAAKEAEVEMETVKTRIKSEIGTARDALKADVQAFGRELAQKVLGRSLQ